MTLKHVTMVELNKRNIVQKKYCFLQKINYTCSKCGLLVHLVKVQDSDSGSVTFCSEAGPSSSSLGSSPDDNSSDGNNEMWQLKIVFETIWNGIPFAICSYLDQYFLVSDDNIFHVCGFDNEDRRPWTGNVRVIIHKTGRTRSMIRSLTAHGSRIAVGNHSQGIIFFSLDENLRKMELLYTDPSRRLVADCILMDDNTAVVSDFKGSIAVLCSDHLRDNANPERNFRTSCAYFMAEVAMSIRKDGVPKMLDGGHDSISGTDK